MILTERFFDAFDYAARLHVNQLRKGGQVPYIAHLMSVSAIVLEHGGGEDEAIAGLLHDANRRSRGPTDPRRNHAPLRRERGPHRRRLHRLGRGTQIKPGARARKPISRGSQAPRPTSAWSPPPINCTTAAPCWKEYRHLGDVAFAKFKGGREGTIWYYRSMTNLLLATGRTPLLNELDRVVSELESLAHSSPR